MYSLEGAKLEILKVLDLNEDRIHSVSDSKFADLASGICFELAKNENKNPKELAETKSIELKKKIVESRFFDKVENLNGFLNFFFSNSFYNDVLKESSSKDFGRSTLGNKNKVLVEFSSPNIGKPMHIGHIRSTILGDAVERLLEFQGFETIRSNYLCDAGAQVGKLMLGIELWGDQNIKNEKDLLDFYVKINTQIEADPKLAERVKEIVEKMENGETVLAEQLEKVRKISLKAFDQNYERLNISFTENLYDSNFVELGKSLAKEAEKLGIAKRGEGKELVAMLEDHKLPNLVILRSNDTTLYSTRDLALAESRFKSQKLAKCIIITASEQNTHFKQAFKILELMGRKYVSKLHHIGFGLIDVQGVKLSSRKGNVLFLADVMDNAKEAALEQVKIRKNIAEANFDDTASEIGVGALKFAILKISPEKNISFDIKKAVQFEGDTGSYVQYAVVRCNSILEEAKAFENKNRKFKEFNDFEKNILKKIAKFPEIAKQSSDSMRPHVLCDYLIDLANAFSQFYANCKVLTDNQVDREKRLKIVIAVRTALKNGLNLLNIPIPEKM